MPDDRFAVLLVCHANVCRSPMAERLARYTLGMRLGAHAEGFDVTSAGTHAEPGMPMHLHAMRVLEELGADHALFRSRPVGTDLVAGADLILTATRGQRAACVTLHPVAVRRTFTLLQFGRLAAAMRPRSLAGLWPPQARLRGLVEELAVVRGELQVGPQDDDDLADPVTRPVEDFRHSAQQILRVVNLMTELIRPI
jgi:protein-tyrosine phosphatase